MTGVFGCGKTVLARAFLNKINRNIYQVALINNPYLKLVEFLRSIARQLGGRGTAGEADRDVRGPFPAGD